MTVSAPALPATMRGVVMHAAGDVRVEDREVPHVIEPTDAVVKLEAACVCGSDLWTYRGIQPLEKAQDGKYKGVVRVNDQLSGPIFKILESNILAPLPEDFKTRSFKPSILSKLEASSHQL